MPRQDRAGIGALEREHRVVREGVLDLHLRRGVLLEPGEVLLVIRRVGHRQVAVLGQAVGEEVVEDPAVLAAEHRVLGAAHGDLRDVVGEDPLEEGLGARAAGLDLAHVRDVEEPGALADGDVLLADALVLHRHLPAGERHELRSRRRVTGVKRRGSKGVSGGGQGARG